MTLDREKILRVIDKQEAKVGESRETMILRNFLSKITLEKQWLAFTSCRWIDSLRFRQYQATPELAALYATIPLTPRFGGDTDDDRYDAYGYDRNGYNCDGYDRNGYNRDGLAPQRPVSDDRYGSNPDGYDRNGYDRNGYNCDGYDRNGYNCDGYDRNGYTAFENEFGGHYIATPPRIPAIGPLQ